MIIEQILPKTPLGVLAVILSLLAAKLVVNRFGGGLNGIPGPFAASFTDWWRVFIVWGRRPELTHIKLHEKYGPLVRLGPRTVSVGNAEAIKTIYALNAGFVKVSPFPRASAGNITLISATVGLLPRAADDRQRPLPAEHVQHDGREVPCQAATVCIQRLLDEHAGQL